MNMSTTVAGDVEVLTLHGRFDAFEAAQVSEWLKERLGSGYDRIVVDMAGVQFVDSTGLAALVRAMKHCRESGGDLVLANLQPAVLMIFELTRLDKAFKVFNSTGAAVRQFDD